MGFVGSAYVAFGWCVGFGWHVAEFVGVEFAVFDGVFVVGWAGSCVGAFAVEAFLEWSGFAG